MIIITIGVAVLMISVAGAVLLAERKASGQQRQTKILLFILFFWVLTFAQLIVVAIGYSLLAM